MQKESVRNITVSSVVSSSWQQELVASQAVPFIGDRKGSSCREQGFSKWVL